VYQRDVVAQCQGNPVAPNSMAETLISSGIDVACSQKSNDGLAHAKICGVLSGNINVFKIKKEDVVKSQIMGFHPISDLPYYSDKKCEPEIEKIYKRFSYSQCDGTLSQPIIEIPYNDLLPMPVIIDIPLSTPVTNLPINKIIIGEVKQLIIPGTYANTQPEVMAQELVNAGIAVKCSQRGHEEPSKVFAAVCGGIINGINVFEVNKHDITQARTKGFRPVAELTAYVDSVCKSVHLQTLIRS